MHINWLLRAQNPYFWIGLFAVIFTAIGISPEIFTSWNILWEQVKELLMNPFKLGCAIVALIGYVSDPTSKGISDTERVMACKKLQE
ncbi:phage holin [Clostridium aminobutyricum]|uniref:Phage holin n=2 Tax=Clostridium aminobutyricum TaxID=33953 RepID=A0A939D9G4_CLOAM|nr:phage holin [Clostridium aminobutyricum]MBN7773657.1 phage holin [Clostridium aminobutyricum]